MIDQELGPISAQRAEKMIRRTPSSALWRARRAIFERLTCGEAAVKDLTARFNAVAKVGRCSFSFELIAL